MIARLLTFAGFIAFWWGGVLLFGVPDYLVPSPPALLAKAWFLVTRGGLLEHIPVTLAEIAIGFVAGALIGLGTGLLFSRAPLLERILDPIIVLIQTAPKISLAPLLILWLGLDLGPKVVLVAIVVFFPIMTGTLAGIRSIDPNIRSLLDLLKVPPWQRFARVDIPHALPLILAGARVATTHAVTAAVIGELVGARAGLGYLLGLGQETADVGMVLVAVLLLSAIGFLFYKGVAQLERRLLAWHESQSGMAL